MSMALGVSSTVSDLIDRMALSQPDRTYLICAENGPPLTFMEGIICPCLETSGTPRRWRDRSTGCSIGWPSLRKFSCIIDFMNYGLAAKA